MPLSRPVNLRAFQDGLNLPDDQFQFLILGVKMWRNADACPRPIVQQEIAAQQLLGYFVSIRNIERDRSATLRSSFRRSHWESILLGQLDQHGCLTDRLGANVFDPNFVDDFVPGPGGVHSWNIGSALQKPERVVRELDRLRIEGEGMPMRHPTRDARL